MIFRTRSSGHVAFHALSPTGISSQFQERLDRHGVSYLEKVGETDLNAVVQASKEASLVYNILDRFQNGDASVLNKVKGAFGDFVNMPSSLAEAHNLIVGIESKFNELPLKIREAFGNSPQIFAKKLQDGSYGEILAKVVQHDQTLTDGVSSVLSSETVQSKQEAVKE